MREVVLDTETTGLNPFNGDRIVEIGAVELEQLVPTGRYFQTYLNPEIKVPEEAVLIHGLSNEFLADKPLFVEIAEEFMNFLGNAPIVIHNASFDINFINEELRRAGLPPIPSDKVIDTLSIARRKFPGAPNSLDALCKRFGIDLSDRELHGALLDAKLLAEVYLELCGGREPGFVMEKEERRQEPLLTEEIKIYGLRKFLPTEEEMMKHKEFLSFLNNPIWLRKQNRS